MTTKNRRTRTPKPFRYRGVWRAQVTLSNGMRPHADFTEFAAAAAWINDTLANTDTSKDLILGGPTQATLCDMLMHYLEHYSLAKEGAAQEINRANHYLTGAGRPEMALTLNEAGHKLLVTAAQARCLKREQQNARGAAAVQRRGGRKAGQTPQSFEAHNQKRINTHPRTYALYAELAAKTASRITKDDISRLHSAMTAENYAASTIHKEIALLKSMFNVARENWEWKNFENPCTGIKLKKGAVRFVVLSTAHRERLRDALAECGNPEFWPLVELVLQTTQRKHSLLTLQWERVDLEHRIMQVRAKGQWAEVPLSLHAVALLESMPGERTGRVFSMTGNAVDCAWDAVRVKAGVPTLHFHDLRHVGGTDYARQGFSSQQLKRVLSHRTTYMADIYVNLANHDVLEAMDRIAADAPALPPSGADRSALRIAAKARRLQHVKRVALEGADLTLAPEVTQHAQPAAVAPHPTASQPKPSTVVQFPVGRARAGGARGVAG